MEFGNIEGLEVGTILQSREEMGARGYHNPRQKGIWGASKTGSCSIVLSEGYEDDIDEIDYIKYTGQGGRNSNSKKQIADQEFTVGNKGLQISCDYNLPVRVWRGFQTKYGPERGYRYDGVYYVTEYERVKGVSGFYICRFHLVSEDSYEKIIGRIDSTIKDDVEPPERVPTKGSRIKRDYSLPDKIKSTYSSRCQICRVKLKAPSGDIAIGAHIKGLGKPHEGPDKLSNMICLCPNHHAQFDAFSFYIEPTNFEIKCLDGFEGKKIKIKHKILEKYFSYHKKIFNEKNSNTQI
jgi:putative restriction endonuclease